MSTPSRPSSPLAPAPVPTATPREIELKLFVPSTAVDRVWSSPLVTASAIGPRRVARLDNRYFDTPDRLLASHRIALRLRRSGNRWVQTLKTGGDTTGTLAARGEWEMPVAGAALELDRLADTPLADLGAADALAARLAPLFSTDFRRESQDLRLPDGSEVELAFDRGTIVAGRGRSRRTLPICEVEIEWKRSAAPDTDVERALLRFAAALAAEVPLIPLAASKAERGYRLSDGEAAAPAKAEPPRPAADDDARRHLARVLSAFVGALLADVHALLALAPDDVDGGTDCVHRARVAIRRLCSVLRLFEPVIRGRRAKALGAMLQALGKDFATVRDLDVFATDGLARIEGHVGTDAPGRVAFDEIRDVTVRDRLAAHVALRAKLDDGSIGATALAIERFAQRLSRASSTDSLGPYAGRWLARQHRRVVRLARRLAELDADARHRLRIEVKRLRYAVDVLGPLYDLGTVDRYLDALADLQGRLGRLNDEFVAKQRLDGLDGGASLVASRYATWFDRHLGKQLPKVAADAVTLELAPRPWAPKRAAAFD